MGSREERQLLAGHHQVAYLGAQARIDVTRAAFDYITELVASHSGDGVDVRSIIHDLFDRVTIIDPGRAG